MRQEGFHRSCGCEPHVQYLASVSVWFSHQTCLKAGCLTVSIAGIIIFSVLGAIIEQDGPHNTLIEGWTHWYLRHVRASRPRDIHVEAQKQQNLARGDCQWTYTNFSIQRVHLADQNRWLEGGTATEEMTKIAQCNASGKSPFGEEGWWDFKELGPIQMAGDGYIYMKTPVEDFFNVQGKIRSIALRVIDDENIDLTLPDFHIHHLIAPTSGWDLQRQSMVSTNMVLSVSDFTHPDIEEKGSYFNFIYPEDTAYDVGILGLPVTRWGGFFIEDFREEHSTPKDIYISLASFVLDPRVSVKKGSSLGLYHIHLNTRSEFPPVNRATIAWSTHRFNCSIDLHYMRPHSHGPSHTILVFKGIPEDIGLGYGQWSRNYTVQGKNFYFPIPGTGSISYAVDHLYRHAQKPFGVDILCRFEQNKAKLSTQRGLFQQFELNSFLECSKKPWKLKANEPLTVVEINNAATSPHMLSHNSVIGVAISPSKYPVSITTAY